MFKIFHKEVVNQFSTNIKVLRIDNRGEHMSKEFVHTFRIKESYHKHHMLPPLSKMELSNGKTSIYLRYPVPLFLKEKFQKEMFQKFIGVMLC